MDVDREEGKLKGGRKKRKLSKKNKVRMCNYFSEYCDSTSIHGFKYLGERKRSCLEKLWWLITIVISISICTVLIYKTYVKWERSPVIVTFATKQTPVWQIPFPAVTICPETKSMQTILNYTELYRKQVMGRLTPKEQREWQYISLICEPHHDKKYNYNFNATVKNNILEFFDKISPTLSNITLDFQWMGQKLNISRDFSPILTDDGVCYTFNMLDRTHLLTSEVKVFSNYMSSSNKENTDWDLDVGYGAEVKQNAFPRRALSSGAKNGLSITLKAHEDDLDYICGDTLQGYKVLLHHPAEIPRVSQHFFRVPLDEAVVAAIRPEIMTTSKELYKYSPEERQCYFPKEKKLRFFKIYTQQNCEIECLTNFTLKQCYCVDFHMPRDAGTAICGAARIKCMDEAEKLLMGNEIDSKLQEIEEEAINQRNKSNPLFTLSKIAEDFAENIAENIAANKKMKISRKKTDCDCLPSCTSLTYSVETSQTEWDLPKSLQSLSDSENIRKVVPDKKVHYSKMLLFIKSNQFIASERGELYGQTDFLANCGGLLGLFTGFSVISLIEIIYFLSLRLWCNIRLHGKKHWAGIDGKKYQD